MTRHPSAGRRRSRTPHSALTCTVSRDFPPVVPGPYLVLPTPVYPCLTPPTPVGPRLSLSTPVRPCLSLGDVLGSWPVSLVPRGWFYF